MLVPYYQCHRSEYAQACRSEERAAATAIEVGDLFHYLAARYFRGWALLHLGRWGEMLRVAREAWDLADKNGQPFSAVYRLQEAWLRAEAFDFAGAAPLVAPALESIRRAGLRTYLPFLGLIVKGMALGGLGRGEASLECFREVAASVDANTLEVRWILRLLHHRGFSQLLLARKDLGGSRVEAERLADLAAQSGERTYLALARNTLAEIALAERREDRAHEEISRAVAVLEGAEAPLAAWRVYATAAWLAGKRKQEAEARSWRDRSAAILRSLAESLADEPSLRRSFLTAPEVRAVLDR